MDDWLVWVFAFQLAWAAVEIECGLLESFRPKSDNPAELNAFLTNVLDHEKDFKFVKSLAKRYRNLPKASGSKEPNWPLIAYHKSPYYAPHTKRNIHHYNHNLNKRFKGHGIMLNSKSFQQQQQQQQRHRRHISHNSHQHHHNANDDDIMKKEEIKKKKDVMDFSSAVHKTNKIHKNIGKGNDESGEANNVYYVDLENNEKRNDNNNDRNDEKRNNDDSRESLVSLEQPLQSNNDVSFTNNNNLNKNVKLVDQTLQQPQQSLLQPQQQTNKELTPSKLIQSQQEIDNSIDNLNYLPQQNIVNNGAGGSVTSLGVGGSDNSNSGFEKAISFEIESALGSKQQPQQQSLIANKNYMGTVDNNNIDRNLVNAANSINNNHDYNINNNFQQNEPGDLASAMYFPLNNANSNEKNSKNQLKHLGNSFIQINKQRRAEHNNNEEEDSDMENSKVEERRNNNNQDEEPQQEEAFENDDNLYNFQKRKLQYIDDSMTEFDLEDNLEDYENWHSRNRRDFTDILDMRNDEDYKDENPYKEDMNINNTDVNNDTNVHKTDEGHNEGECHHSKNVTNPPTTTTTTTTTCGPHAEVDRIKEILKEPKEAIVDNSPNGKKANNNKQSRLLMKKTQYSQIKDFNSDGAAKVKQKKRKFNENPSGGDGSVKNKVTSRQSRQLNQMEDKIMENKDKIFKFDGGQSAENYEANNDGERVEREEQQMNNWNENGFGQYHHNHRIDKKEDLSSDPLASAVLSGNGDLNGANCSSGTTVGSTDIVANTTEAEINNSTYEQVAHQMDLENEKLAQVVNGHFASKIVSTVFAELRKKAALKAKFVSGLSRKHMNYDGNIEMDIFKSNDSDDASEARLLLEQLTKVLNKLVMNQVRRKLCQRLPEDLKDYLHTIIDVKNPIEVGNYEPNEQQGTFMFSYQQEEDAAATRPFDVRKLQETLVNLEGLLLSYHNLNADCRERAEPVKDYIERHVKMLRKIVACPDKTCGKKNNGENKHQEDGSRKRDVEYDHKLIEKQLESVGLGQKSNFIPNFDVNAIIKSKLNSDMKDKRTAKMGSGDGKKSEKFRKLQSAAAKVREKRENEKKIGELFGGSSNKKNKRSVDFEEPVVYSLGA